MTAAQCALCAVWDRRLTLCTIGDDPAAAGPAELPYGWDEAVDDYIGVYYIECVALATGAAAAAAAAPRFRRHG